MGTEKGIQRALLPLLLRRRSLPADGIETGKPE
jgi:hypothetical protein